MLHYEAIYPETLELLNDFSNQGELEQFFLVGGTAIALHIGHRISVDLDFFTKKDINTDNLKIFLRNNYDLVKTETDINSLNCFINYKEKIIKVDFISYKYDLLKPIKNIDNIKLLELDDLIPMKLSAIAGRGSKKDFYDIFFLFDKYSLSDMLEFFKHKYKTENVFHLIKSLTYFEDADNEPEPILLKKVKWETVKNKIISEEKKII
ncbi:MAG: nucleotidyl transferase AbiEii/AbiGii toxin family protein [Bacteroidales bacterium]|nr:nucleotidyl transferase AbiEii/AbiGii toxin family protein [Bacteroidales bacterium]